MNKTTWYRAEQESVIGESMNGEPQMPKIKVLTRELYSKRDDQNLFATKDEALVDYRKALVLACEKYKVIKQSLAKLKEELGFDISYTMEGDTHGIYEDYQYISVKANGYEILFEYKE